MEGMEERKGGPREGCREGGFQKLSQVETLGTMEWPLLDVSPLPALGSRFHCLLSPRGHCPCLQHPV